jgi:hypothetical protein
VQEYVKKIAGGLLVVWLAVPLASCGRSESIGWSDREKPASAGQGAASQVATQQGQTEAEERLQEVMEEYGSVARTLAGLQQTAMGDPDLSARWGALVAEVDAAILRNSKFHRELAERRSEIEDRINAHERGEGESLSQGQLAELARHHRNIQMEMARMRSSAFEQPEYAERYLELQAELYEKMKQLDPSRAEDIDRLAQLEAELYELQQLLPDKPGATPPGL